MSTDTLPDLSRTKTALQAYDAYQIDWEATNLLEQINERDGLAEKVGEAYGLDTADINDFETCKARIRPGKCQSVDSFLRRMVAKWEQECKS